MIALGGFGNAAGVLDESIWRRAISQMHGFEASKCRVQGLSGVFWNRRKAAINRGVDAAK